MVKGNYVDSVVNNVSSIFKDKQDMRFNVRTRTLVIWVPQNTSTIFVVAIVGQYY